MCILQVIILGVIITDVRIALHVQCKRGILPHQPCGVHGTDCPPSPRPMCILQVIILRVIITDVGVAQPIQSKRGILSHQPCGVHSFVCPAKRNYRRCKKNYKERSSKKPYVSIGGSHDDLSDRK
jgi:hypothetical protein